MDDLIVAKLREVVSNSNWDALVLLSPENFAYATGFVVPSHPLMRWRRAACVVPRNGPPQIMVVDMEAKTTTAHLPDLPLTTYNEFIDRPMSTLAELLHDLGLTHPVIGIELDYLSASDAEELRKALPGAEFVRCDEVIAFTRTRKTRYEIERLRDLSRLTDATILDSLTSVAAGMTEMDIASRLTRGIFERGADTFKLMIVASGERSGYPNVGPSSRILCEGDLARVEIFGMRDGYHAGVCRTAVVGRPTQRQKEVWSVIIECRNALLTQIRPGASTKAIYSHFVSVFQRAGLPAISFVGHGIGVYLHEEPYIGKYDDRILEAGMVLGIEPLVYAPGQGMQNKDMVLVTESGCELLSDVTLADELIEIAC